jgi:hypothetical protein
MPLIKPATHRILGSCAEHTKKLNVNAQEDTDRYFVAAIGKILMCLFPIYPNTASSLLEYSVVGIIHNRYRVPGLLQLFGILVLVQSAVIQRRNIVEKH